MAIRFHCQCGKLFSLPDNVAGRKARCQQCGKVLTVPMAHRAASEPAGAASAPSGGAGKLASSVPAGAAPPRGEQGVAAGDAKARRTPPAGDDVPVARMADEPEAAAERVQIETKRRPAGLAGRRAFSLRKVATVTLISTAVLAAVSLDTILFVAQKSMAGDRPEGWVHALWLIALPIGFLVAMFASQGSVFCIGALMGGAGGLLLLRAPLTLLGAVGGFFPRWVIAVGALELVLGGVYLRLLLGATVRRRLAGHGPAAMVGIVIGLFFGEAVSPTAYPSPVMFITRGLYTSKASPLVARWLPSREEGVGEDHELLARNYLAGMTYAIGEYTKAHEHEFPPDLSALRKSEKFDPSRLGGISGGKVEYVFGTPGGRPYTVAQVNGEERDVVQELVFAYIQRDPPFGSGVLVLRPPVAGVELIQWVPRTSFADTLRKTRKWLEENVPKEPDEANEPRLGLPNP
jgi:hypothetical protein